MANASSGKLILSFEVYNGSQHLFRKELSAESVTIGRGPAAMLRVQDDALADLHAVINVNDDGTVQLLDLGSVLVDTSDDMTEIRKAGAGDKPHIACANHRNAHGTNLDSASVNWAEGCDFCVPRSRGHGCRSGSFSCDDSGLTQVNAED